MCWPHGLSSNFIGSFVLLRCLMVGCLVLVVEMSFLVMGMRSLFYKHGGEPWR